MSSQRRVLPDVLGVCREIHDRCAVVLIGSVARGGERPNSDIDLNIIFPGDELPQQTHRYVDDDNRWQLQLKDEIRGVRIDVAWETESELMRHVTGDDVIHCWPFSNGVILHDPYDIASPSLKIAQQWFAERPEIGARIEQQYDDAKSKQRQRQRSG
ncbi:MAG: nucleotidyltransferase domain-containing protein [Pirellulaceae bacterium]|jgi:predicted nucleotidyltransferase|nr:nucleotidyltransferase domain-containing protein [Pirellulaceae bacterium]MDP7014928.1 nucleotidyltransferase domain-containing protein [Pirellulaceae bacterium]